MVTLQEYLDNRYPTKEDKEKVWEINTDEINNERYSKGITEKLEGGELYLSQYFNLERVVLGYGDKLKTPLTKLSISGSVNLKMLDCFNNQINSISLSDCFSLERLVCGDNNLTSVDFLDSLPNPEKLDLLVIRDNNIQPTDIKVFSRFVNLYQLGIGTNPHSLERSKRNKFYGSFKGWKSLTKLSKFCIEDTDIDSGLEYISSERGYFPALTCSFFSSDAKVAIIQNELRPFNYDIESWQLAHPEKMLVSRPELFTNPDSKDKWIKALDKKVGQAQREILTTKLNEPDKTKRVERLESKVQNLNQVKETLEKSTQTDLFTTANKSIQTEETTIPSKTKKSRVEKEAMILELLKELQEEDKQEGKITSYHLEGNRFIKVTCAGTEVIGQGKEIIDNIEEEKVKEGTIAQVTEHFVPKSK